MTAAHRHSNEFQPTLYLALELSSNEWMLGFTVGFGQKPRRRRVPAGQPWRVLEEIKAAIRRFGLPQHVRVLSCYEAGRDGFWVHRALEEMGVETLVVDSASIEVARRQRRPKTDRLDVEGLLTVLIRYDLGDKKALRVCRVPTIAEEDARHPHRELKMLKGEQTRSINRIQGLLSAHGVSLVINRDFPRALKEARLYDGRTPLPEHLRHRLLREFERLQVLRRQIREIEKEMRVRVRQETSEPIRQVRQLLKLRGVGLTCSWLFVKEFFAWRKLRNRREVAGLAGLTPTPYRSGTSNHEQGISRAGNRWIRAVAIELAWAWIRWQPGSALSQWFLKGHGRGGPRMRKVGIVAVARKLLVALWQYLETGQPPAGADLVDWRSKINKRAAATRATA